jgi:ABC-type Zn uptake system ZnuABC Zn-binding protein ZnuA
MKSFIRTLSKAGVVALMWLSAFPAVAKLNVVASLPDLAAIAMAIGGEHTDVFSLARPLEDPHFVEAKPSLIVKLSRADALIEGGAELEGGWLPALLDRCRNSRIASGAPGRISCSQAVALLEIPTSLDRSKGDIHADGNPHYLVDPLNAKAVAKLIAEAFCRLDPAHAAAYQAHLTHFTSGLEVKLSEWTKQLEPYQGREVAAYHNSWLYFAQRFGLKIELFLEPKPGVPPTPPHLAEVIAQMKSRGVKAIIVDPYLDRRTAEAVAAKSGAVVVDVAQFPGGLKGTENDYLKLMDQNIKAIIAALSK